jgi:hypothetical protein
MPVHEESEFIVVDLTSQTCSVPQQHRYLEPVAEENKLNRRSSSRDSSSFKDIIENQNVEDEEYHKHKTNMPPTTIANKSFSWKEFLWKGWWFPPHVLVP